MAVLKIGVGRVIGVLYDDIMSKGAQKTNPTSDYSHSFHEIPSNGWAWEQLQRKAKYPLTHTWSFGLNLSVEKLDKLRWSIRSPVFS